MWYSHKANRMHIPNHFSVIGNIQIHARHFFGYLRKNDINNPYNSFVRDLKWNPHIHVLCTEGGMDQNSVYHSVNYINYESLRKSFLKQLLDKMKAALPKGSKEYIQLSQLISRCYQDNREGFYVNAPPNGMDEKGKDKVVSYIIRYTGRPAMAQSRISSYSYEKKEISYWYDDHKSNKHITVFEHVYQFMLKLIRHIPDRNFKMTRYYGIYVCADHKHKKSVRLKLKQKSINSSYRRLHYRRSLITVFGVDPLLCTCGLYMEYVDFYVPSRTSCSNVPP